MKNLPQSEHYLNVQNTDKFQHYNGFFVLDFECIMTKNQIVNVKEEYQLVDFTNGEGIQLREVVFWHALIKDSFLKIIVYDPNDKVLIHRLHDLTKPKYHCDWFLIEEDVFEDDILEFGF